MQPIDLGVACVEPVRVEAGESERGATAAGAAVNRAPEDGRDGAAYYDRRDHDGGGGAGGARGLGRGFGRGLGRGRGRGRGWPPQHHAVDTARAAASSFPPYAYNGGGAGGPVRRNEPIASTYPNRPYYPSAARPPTQNGARSSSPSVPVRFCFKCAQTGHVTRDCKFYKTRFCSYFTSQGSCQYTYDSRMCVYAHGAEELRPVADKYCVRIVYENGEQMIFGCGAAGHSIDTCPCVYGAVPPPPPPAALAPSPAPSPVLFGGDDVEVVSV